jgi:hypothetical protein
MGVLAFDTLSVTKLLKTRGFNESQAEAIAEVIQSSRETELEHMATKSDLKDLEITIVKWMFGGFFTLGLMILGVLLKH